MSDPRTVGPQQRSANLSELMKAKGKASLGEKVNFCPFGCSDDQLDEQGYCDHLVGIALPGNEAMERVVKDERGRRRVLGAQTVPIGKKDRLVRITTCSRVYREGPAPKE